MTSVLDLFTIGIGPSSSHTVGPMRAARRFVEALRDAEAIERTDRLVVSLYGSLASTGHGHGTDRAILLGLERQTPESVPVDQIPAILNRIRGTKRVTPYPECSIAFDESSDLQFLHAETLSRHSNAMRFDALDAAGRCLLSKTYYSVGGGFIVDDQEEAVEDTAGIRQLPYAFRSGDEMLAMGRQSGLSVSRMTLENENTYRQAEETRARLLAVWKAMRECAERGCHDETVLPGSLMLRRRAPRLYRELTQGDPARRDDPLRILDWVSLWAIAVNEENAAGHRVVTAPTNGAAGIIPAVLHYFVTYLGGGDDDGIVRFLLTAGAIGMLYKQNASISGAEVGCQGEVGVACSMAAGALAEVLGGNVAQVEEAAEIGMEHNLGLTCDPVGGLVQVPCIERNAMGAVKAIQAARLALASDGVHRVSLDKVIATMKQTGADMSSKYKETSHGGLAVNVPQC
ncbi:MAG: L-serine ammonia-lyase [Planctomycetaceae bacterium]|nr:MAG: L-serine ammonia-lyase [Planctomycetaceae bacterium]